MFGFLKKPHQFFAMRFKTELERIGFVYVFDGKTPLLEIKWGDSIYKKFTTVDSYVRWVKTSPMGTRGKLMWDLIVLLDREKTTSATSALLWLRAFDSAAGLLERTVLFQNVLTILSDSFKAANPTLVKNFAALQVFYNGLHRGMIPIDHSIQNTEPKEQRMNITQQFLNQKDISICIHELCKLDYKFTYNGDGSKAVTVTIEPPRDLRHPTTPTVTVALESDLIAFFDNHPEAGRVLVLEELHHLLDSLDISVNAVRHALEVKASDTIMRKYNSLLPVIETARSTSNEAVLRIASKLEAMALNYSDHPSFVSEEFVPVPIPKTLNEHLRPMAESRKEIDPNMSTGKPRRDRIDSKLFDLSFLDPLVKKEKESAENNEVTEMATFGYVLQSPSNKEHLDELTSIDFKIHLVNSVLTVKHVAYDHYTFTFGNAIDFQKWLISVPFANRLDILRRLEKRLTKSEHFPLRKILVEVIHKGVTDFHTKIEDFTTIENALRSANPPLLEETTEIGTLFEYFLSWGKVPNTEPVEMMDITPKAHMQVEVGAILNLMGKVGPLGDNVYASSLNDALLFGGKREQLVNDLRVRILNLCPTFLESSSVSEVLRFYNSYNQLVRLLCTSPSPSVTDIKRDFVILASFTFDSVYHRMLSEIALLILKLEAAE